MNIKEYVRKICINAKESKKQIACLNEKTKNQILEDIIEELDNNRENIISANNTDVENLKSSKNFVSSFVDRLLIDDNRILRKELPIVSA